MPFIANLCIILKKISMSYKRKTYINKNKLKISNKTLKIFKNKLNFKLANIKNTKLI